MQDTTIIRAREVNGNIKGRQGRRPDRQPETISASRGRSMNRPTNRQVLECADSSALLVSCQKDVKAAINRRSPGASRPTRVLLRCMVPKCAPELTRNRSTTRSEGVCRMDEAQVPSAFAVQCDPCAPSRSKTSSKTSFSRNGSDCSNRPSAPILTSRSYSGFPDEASRNACS